jgi:5'(3')-deoxyribonucleotidase
MKPQIFLDCDGVLADFDAGFEQLAGMPGQEYEDKFGPKKFWSQIKDSRNFFETLPLMPGAKQLYELVKEHRPIILTGCPRGGWAEAQKMRWRDKYFPGVPMVTCASRNKVHYCQPGDVLIDDYLKHSQKWIDGGGIFIHHVNFETTAATLQNMELIPKKYIRALTYSGDFYVATAEKWKEYWDAVNKDDWRAVEYLEEGNDKDFYYAP